MSLITYVRKTMLWAGICTLAFLVSGCSILFGSGPEPTPTAAVARQLVPTFTPTTNAPPEPAATTAPLPTDTPAPAAPVTNTNPITASTALTATDAPTATTNVTPTTEPKGRLTVTQDLVNTRLGPGTDYGLAGEVNQGQTFDIIGKTQAGDWWQICCVNGQQVWIFGQLVTTENAEAVAVVTDLPTKPVAEATTAPTQAPAEPQPEPTATPEPQVEAPPPPAADPCAGIGGDGCKFRISGGPATAPNGGTELKLQFMFMHSGDGGRPQGSYFVAMFKDGQKLPIGDGTRSLVDVRQQGTLGEYNYEYKVGLGDIPGNTVAGTYTVYVLDGNGERDSTDFTINVPDGQGEIWIQFDQG